MQPHITNDMVRQMFSQGQKYFIHSIFPITLKAERTFNGITTYVLPAASPTSVETLEITNAFQTTSQAGTHVDVPIFSSQIAADLYNEFALSMIGQESGLGPGIWISESPIPKPEEVEIARQRQTAWFRFLDQQALKLYDAREFGAISDLHRVAATWLGLQGRPYVQKIEQTVLKKCVHCRSEIDSQATVCPVCRMSQVAQRQEPEEVAAVRPAQRGK